MGMADEELIDHERIARAYDRTRLRMRADPGRRKALIRAQVRVVKGFLKEARTGRYTFRSDEPVESGGTAGAPFPLHYFVAGVGF
jgi:hypothetical protein